MGSLMEGGLDIGMGFWWKIVGIMPNIVSMTLASSKGGSYHSHQIFWDVPP